MRRFLVFLLVIQVLFLKAQSPDELAARHQLSLRLSVNNYRHSLYNKLINTWSVDAGLHSGRFTIRTKRAEWLVQSKFTQFSPGVIDATVSFVLINGNETESAVAVELDFGGWSKDNYVLMPAAAYNGNRFESRKIPYSPKLNDYRDIGPDKPIIISDVPRLNIHEGPSLIQERSGGMTLPCIGFHAPAIFQGALVIATQENKWGDYGINMEESRSGTARVSLISPLVRERFAYEIANNAVASPDIPADFKQGDEVLFRFRIRLFPSNNIQTLFDQFLLARRDLIPTPVVNFLYPFSESYSTIKQKFNTQNFVSEWGYYSVGMRENFLQDWQIGWTGGMISTYPLLFAHDSLTLRNVAANFRWLFPNGISPSGFFWDSGEKGNRWYGGDVRRPQFANLHLIRKSGDGLYYVLKQLELMKLRQIPVDSEWEKGTRRVADAFVTLWKKWGQYGNFVDSHTGDVVVGGSTSGAIVPAALVLAARYFNEPAYLDVALQSASGMYLNYVSKGITCGGPGDAMQNPDSESAYAMLESFALLYEHTRDEKWLTYAREMAAQFSTWVMSYDYRYADITLFGRLDMKTTGTVFANTQNKHGSPGICTHSGLALLRLYRATGNPVYLQLLKEITQAIPQYMSHSSRTIAGMPPGWINERVSTTDWFEGIGEIKPGSTWAETALLLTAVELPSIYVDTELKSCYAFDHLKAELIGVKRDVAHIRITNPTQLDAEFTVLAENKLAKLRGWEESRMWNRKKYRLKAGATIVLKVVVG